MVNGISRELVLKKLAFTFPDPAIAEQALQSLDRYGDREKHPHVHLVHLAILKLSKGELWKLREMVESARRDFRDVVLPAQAPERMEAVKNASLPHNGLVAKTLSTANEEALDKRDHDQWIAWLSS